MRLTTKGRFAVTAMIDLALRERTGPVTLAAISQRQRISLSYLEQLFGKLRRHKLVESTRGPGGGYSLGRKAAEITVADIIFSIEDEPSEKREPDPGADGRCSTEELWASLNRRTVEFLDSVTLQSLVLEQLAKEEGVAPGKPPESLGAAGIHRTVECLLDQLSSVAQGERRQIESGEQPVLAQGGHRVRLRSARPHREHQPRSP